VRRANTKKYLRLIEGDDPLEQPELDESRFENLVTWIYGNQKSRQVRLIGSIRDIPLLDTILGHPKSTQALENGANLNDALEEAQEAGHTAATHLGRAKKSIQRATSVLSDVRDEDRPEVQQARSSVTDALSAFDSALEAGSKRTDKRVS